MHFTYIKPTESRKKQRMTPLLEFEVEHPAGIEPVYPAWEASVLPLN